ncbi:MAG: PAS domain S-box protein [Desulfovibrionaceae bacterium]
MATAPFSTLFREFFRRFSLLASGILLIGGLYYHIQSSNHQARLEADSRVLLQVESQLVHSFMDSAAADVRTLAAVAHERALDPEGLSEFNESLVRILTTFAQSHPEYSQLRYLDPEGREQIRIDNRLGVPELLSRPQLQNKSAEPYFQRALELKPGQVYISPLNLNREQGTIERPFRPTIRFASPVRLPGRQKPGFLVINANGQRLLKELQETARPHRQNILLLNHLGYWLLAPESRMEWGQYLPGRAKFTFQNRYQAEWKRMRQEDNGQFQTAKGLFSFLRVNPQSALSDPCGPCTEESWILLFHHSPAELTPAWQKSLLLLIAGLLVFVAGIALYLAHAALEQHQAEAEARDAEDKVKAISQSSHDALIMVDEEGLVVFWNPAAESMLGYNSEETLGKSANAFLSPDRDCAPGSRAPALKAGPFSGEPCQDLPTFFRRKDGTVFPAEVALSSFLLRGKWWTVNAVRDTTKRVNALNELEKSKELLNEAMKISRMGGFSYSLQTKEIFWTEEMRILHGVTSDFKPSLEGMASFFSPDDRKSFTNALQSVLRGNPVRVELQLLTAKDRKIWMRISLHPKHTVDRVSRVFGIYHDITDRKLERARLEQLSAAVEHSPASVLITDAAGVIEYVNAKFTEVSGYSPTEVLGNTPAMLQSGLHDKNFYAEMWQTIGKGRDWSGEVCTRTKSGQLIWEQLSISPVLDEKGRVQNYIGIKEDVTERKKAREQLEASERKIRAMSESTLDAMLMIDSKGLISFWNKAAEKMFGHTEQEALGKEVHDLIAEEQDRSEAKASMPAFSRSGIGAAVGHTRDLIALRKDGSRFPCEITVASFQLEDKWYAVGAIRDITRRREYERRLRELATTDELTGLYNRRAFLETAQRELERSLRYSRPLSLVMLDVDHFKKVNDTYGHGVGDKVLKALARAGLSALRTNDVLGRLGGEEFAVLLPETGPQQAIEAAERIRAAIGSIVIADERAPEGEIHITASAGVATLGGALKDVESTLKAADEALYRAKDLGRDRTETA